MVNNILPYISEVRTFLFEVQLFQFITAFLYLFMQIPAT
jgi:hypothetical protein